MPQAAGHARETNGSGNRCPVTGAAGNNAALRGATNADGWPRQLRLDVLHRHSPLSDPMGDAFDYATVFESLDLDAGRGSSSR